MINLDDFLPEPGVIVHPDKKEGDGTESSLPQQETNMGQGKVDNSADRIKDLPSAEKTSSLMQDINFMIARMKEEGPNAGIDPAEFMGKVQTVLQHIDASNPPKDQGMQAIIQSFQGYIHQVSESQQGKMSAEAIAGLGVLQERLEALQTHPQEVIHTQEAEQPVQQPQEVIHTQEVLDFANAVPLNGGNQMPLGQTHSQGQPLQSVQPISEAGQAPEQNGAFGQTQSDFNTTKNSPKIQTISEEGVSSSSESETGKPDGSDVFPPPQGFIKPSQEEEDLINEEKEALGISEPAQHVQPTQEAGQPAQYPQEVMHTQEALDFANAVPLEGREPVPQGQQGLQGPPEQNQPAQHIQSTQEAGQVVNQSTAEQTQAQEVIHTQEALDFANAVPLNQPTQSSEAIPQQETVQSEAALKDNPAQSSEHSTSTEQDQTEQKDQQSQVLDEAPEDSVYDPNDPEGKKKKKSKEGLAASILALFAQFIPPNMAIFGIKRKGMGK